ncbi:MAG: hypothetical protein MUE46_11045 [Xanthomonadales bacterium]|jgi:hypothetical protein|nr:hypothetical protein [Xanthomonadales bacterium]
MRRILQIGLLSTLLTLGAVASANTLLVERSAREKGAVPERGMLMDAVEAQWGAPQERLGPVPAKPTKRNPPITTWRYPAFTVYFEHQHVVATVLNRSHALEKGPKPVPASGSEKQ